MLMYHARLGVIFGLNLHPYFVSDPWRVSVCSPEPSLQLNLSKMVTLKRPKIVFQYQLLLNAGQKYCRMLHGEHSAILSTFIKLPFVIKIFVLSFYTPPLKCGEVLCYTLRCLSVRPSVRPSVLTISDR